MVTVSHPHGEHDTLILASSSPRRYHLLTEAGVRFEVVAPVDVAEDFPPGEKPQDLVIRHALAKARSVARERAGRMVLGVDTVVVLDGVIYGKPADEIQAHEYLKILQGRTHTVFSGLALIVGADGRELTAYEATDVTIRPLSDEEIDIYIETGEPLDKAGAYAIQGKGAFLVERVDGDYFNVVGLPLYHLSLLLAQLGFELFR